jgi:hypothetical protein
MTYQLLRLTPGSFDLVLDGEVVASVVRSSIGGSGNWYVEPIDERGPRPWPFSEPVHEFDSFADAARWLGNPEPVTSETA